MKKFKTSKGVSLIEYMVLVMLILGGLYLMKDTINRGLFARFKSTGDSFAYGRQYDAKRTSVCKTDQTDAGAEVSYDEDCYATRVQLPVSGGGCPQCYPGDRECFQCEDQVKSQCPCSKSD